LTNLNGKRFSVGNFKINLNSIHFSTFSKSNYSTKPDLPIKDSDKPTLENVSVFQKMKQLTKNYWNVLIPVHLVTSVCWASMFYIAIK
jgi:hypothetical protein